MTKRQEKSMRKRLQAYLSNHSFCPSEVTSDYVLDLWMGFATKEVSLAERRVKTYNLQGVSNTSGCDCRGKNCPIHGW